MRAAVCAGMTLLALLRGSALAGNTVAGDVLRWTGGSEPGGSSFGAVGAAGYRRGALSLLGEFQGAWFEDRRTGITVRVAAMTRFTLLRDLRPSIANGSAAAVHEAVMILWRWSNPGAQMADLAKDL